MMSKLSEALKKANSALSRISKSAWEATRKRYTIRRYVYVRDSQGRWYRLRRKGDRIALRFMGQAFVCTLRPDGHVVGVDAVHTLSHLHWQARKPDAAYTDGGAW